MGDWLMENGDRSYHSGEFAYDTDNDAWCEMGSTEGSTPVWWRKYKSGNGSSRRRRRRRRLSAKEQKERNQLELQFRKEQKDLNAYKKELSERSSEKHIEKVKDQSTSLTLFFALPLSLLILVFLGAALGVSENNVTLILIVIGTVVATFAICFFLLSYSGKNTANKEIAEAKRKVADQERVVSDIREKLKAYD